MPYLLKSSTPTDFISFTSLDVNGKYVHDVGQEVFPFFKVSLFTSNNVKLKKSAEADESS